MNNKSEPSIFNIFKKIKVDEGESSLHDILSIPIVIFQSFNNHKKGKNELAAQRGSIN